ncbi:MAG: 50S ribosomal protein L11 methyltransferase [Oceanibaculum nanhaiense]|uniref:class I SAM-dependent methyltransferase n=1 Tax=Oceanibaculum nanhaiense TaxID=1909734 RepID=UPI0025A383D1|nr:50S ribosomal protein L11 methyltransferase [Oceanibaculum nanhaiense]MDM7944969.1 50S ribosomal protein L11 methyltransferase [Oceanibaculum nanhaiense]
MIDNPEDFIIRNTRLGAAPLVPELALYLADAVMPLWEMTEADLERQGVPPPYWAFAWPGGQAVARLILDRPELVKARRVLDLGAGGGIAAIAAMRAGALRATANDIDALALAAIALNAAANGVTIDALGRDLLDDVARDWDIILAGDLCYEKPMAGRVMGWLRTAASTGTTVLLGDPGRAYAPADGLYKLGDFAVPVSRDLEDRDIRHTAVWQVLPG